MQDDRKGVNKKNKNKKKREQREDEEKRRQSESNSQPPEDETDEVKKGLLINNVTQLRKAGVVHDVMPGNKGVTERCERFPKIHKKIF